MKLRFLFLAVLAFISVVSQWSIAQDDLSDPLKPGQTKSRIYLGPVVGYNNSIHSVDLASFANDLNCPTFVNGSASGFHVGVFYEHLFGVTSKHSLVARFLYNALPANISHEGDNHPSLVDDGQGGYTTVISTTEHTVAVGYNLLSLDIMYKFRAFGNFVLTVGPTLDFVMSNSLVQKYSLIKPDNVQFKEAPQDADGYPIYEDNFRTMIVYDGEIGKGLPVASTRFGLKFGAQYEIRLGGMVDLIPGFFYNLGLTNATDNEDWKVSAIQASIDIRFAL